MQLSKLELTSEPGKYLLEAFQFVPDLLFAFKSKVSNFKKLISVLDIGPGGGAESLIELICHQMYENIINPQNEEFLLLCTALLSDEIQGMNSPSIYSFLDSSFIGKLLNNFTKRHDLRNYLAMTLKDLILNIENLSDHFMDLNAYRIFDYIKSKSKAPSNKAYVDSNKKALFSIDHEQLTKRIRKSIFVKRKQQSENSSTTLESKKYDSTLSSFKVIAEEQETSINLLDNLDGKDNDLELVLEEVGSVVDLAESHDNTNRDYLSDLTQKELNLRLLKCKDNAHMRSFYENQLKRVKEDPDMFTNKRLLNYIKSLPEFGEEVMRRYKDNFEKIKDYIDSIYANLRENLSTIPYTVRCICKIINVLIQSKFPDITVYERNAFLGDFFFGKCVIPILANPDQNAIVTSTFLSDKTKMTLISLGKIIKKINIGYFFESSSDMNLTIFNHYFIEIMPEIIEFYDRLIDIKLPDAVQELLDNAAAHGGDINSLKTDCLTYDYFKYHPDELLHIETICYSVKDVNLLIRTLRKNINLFKDDDVIVRAFNKSTYQENFLSKLEKEKGRKFMLAYRIKNNPLKSDSLQQKVVKHSFSTNADSPDNIVTLVKFCIKLILKSLNIINPKTYSHLTYANTTEDFFMSLNEVVQFEEFTELENGNKIPLNWYALYLASNMHSMPEEYRKDNFKKLYYEILSEENEEISFLKNKSNLIITCFGMASRCSEKVIEQMKRDLSKMTKIHKFVRMDRFLKKTKVKVCVRLNKQKDEVREESNRKTGGFLSLFRTTVISNVEKVKEPSIIIKSSDKCIHKQLQYLDELKEGKVDKKASSSSKIDCHAETVSEFIRLFVKFPEIKEDIANGEQVHMVSESLSTYISLVKAVLSKNELFKDCSDDNLNEIAEEIEIYIIKKIYRRVYPEREITRDKKFYEETCKLAFVRPEHMDINKNYLNEAIWISAVNELSKIDSEKSPIGKLSCVINAVNIIINCIRFCTGKFDGGYSVEDFMPILNYIIIKSKPKRMISNFNFIDSLLDENKKKGVYGNMLTNLNFSLQYIQEIDHTKLNISKEDFDNEINKYRLMKNK